jgi:hypothetical protein
MIYLVTMNQWISELQLILPLFSFRAMFFAILGHCLDINLPPFCASAIFIVLTSTLPPYFLLQSRLWNLQYWCIGSLSQLCMDSFMSFHLHLNHHVLIRWCTSQMQQFIASASHKLYYRPLIETSALACPSSDDARTATFKLEHLNYTI